MFNVLPNNFKELIKRQYKKRYIIIWLMAVICLQISLIIFTLPSYVYLVTEKRNLLAENSSINQTTASGDNSTTVQIFHNVNTELAVMSSDISINNIDVLVAKLISLKGPSIKIEQLLYKNETATSSIFLKGVSADRQSLLSFSKSVEADSDFSNVDLPVSNFAKDKDINFTMNMKVQN